MANPFAFPSRNVSSRPYCCFVRSFAGKGCTDTHADGNTLGILSFLKGGAPGQIYFWIFCCRQARCRDAFLLAFINGADSYTKLQLIVFAS